MNLLNPLSPLKLLNHSIVLVAILVALLTRRPPRPSSTSSFYGGTSAGVIAAVQAKKMGKSVVVVCPDKHLGGLSSGGLGFTDTGNKAVIGGLSREFYHRVWQHYDQPEAWKWQKKRGVRQQGPGHAGHRRRAAHDVDLRAARRRAGLRGLRQGARDPRRTATSGSTARRA